MTLLSCSNVGISFGATELFKNVTFTVADGERWGIIGRNGAGKTSIFKVITGDLQPTVGSVARKPGLRHALLDQHRAFEGATTVWEAGAAAWREVIALEHSIAEQAMQLGELGDRITDEILERFGHDQERFADLGGYIYHARVDAVLQGLGFDAEESKTRLVSSLSGGERGRVGLAAQLIAPADLLLLDEPTNHLDLDTTTWLQDWLKEADETVIVVSHDRAFLDAICTNILHVEARTSESYKGNYSAFVPQRAERRLTREREMEKQRAYVKKEEEYIRRNLAGVNSFQAKGKRKRLERLPRLAPPPGDPAAMTLHFEPAERGGDQVVAIKDLRVEVPGRVLVEDFTAVLRRNDFVALIGPNGAGKSSFISTLLGDRAPANGEARVGSSITAAWFRQDLADLPLRKSLSDAINDHRPLWNRGQVQNHLGAFGFSGDEVFREIGSLSGGERARMALALMTLKGANLLVLDEPTNHLDVENIEVLEDALDEYEGTVLLVSHDRAFLREVATRVWAFDGARLIDFDGPFVEWEEDRARRAQRSKRPAGASER
ncbi:MAG: ABC-F family ATP-binding cassette domain-containing protein [Gemmatimonadetes bacterium]|nr:ABC-F family ATP-binding cassette domain-containing protein [Gemmatimonadota bacterium]MBK6844870.1 ABC-F family ATP-binding cassette domain-containing protein [Gemmatimonadota bacterium]MBK7834324.1 ABC-F family ATP-binding cassette domain-containing protein [Gemmatimonadota bacterium]MBK9409295.1 ABC-F family ATP-binding cassette domain-containing protein [Gemmatimonadota bacterium]MBP9105876.1 ABC-F family ATP-binding cassette domain-containing protein [Gemmatimonadaceae bacterium]